MYITQEADYAVRIVCCLAKDGGRRDAKFIAEHTGVSLRFALKILRKLVASGVTVSFKGRSGGYELAKSPAETTLCEVIETVDGPYALSRCLRDDKHDCAHVAPGCCDFRDIYMDISKTITDKLSKVTFDRFL
ncbi:MAG: Rrf2 family transcriptional regulator [Oscillospiraceae bacterium]